MPSKQALTMLRDFAGWLRPAGWPALPAAVRVRVRALAWLAIAAQVVFVAGWIIAGGLEPHYSPLRSYYFGPVNVRRGW